MSARGFSLAESLIATAILSLLALVLIPAFITQLDANTQNELRVASMAAAQQVLEGLRLDDPMTLPSAGTRGPLPVDMGDLDFEVVVHFCRRQEFCDTGSRHLLLEVYHAGRKTYDVETVYTQLR